MSVEPFGNDVEFAVLDDSGHARRILGSDWPAGDEKRFILAVPQGVTVPISYLTAAVRLMTDDDRVASVSLADGVVAALARVPRVLEQPALATTPHWAPASCPAGTAIVFNLRVFDLVGLPAANGLLSREALTAWSVRSNHRGLRHLWWTSGEPADRVAGWAPAAMDVREAAEPLTPLCLLVERYRASHAPLRVGVEASWLREFETGAQVATVHWVSALVRRPDVGQLLLLNLPNDSLPSYAQHLAGLDKLRIVTSDAVPADQPDIYWRPYQPDPSTALSTDRRLGRRLVTTILDLIEFTNERYHGNPDNWYNRRRQFRRYARQVDALTGISDDVVDHLSVEIPGLDPGRMFTTPLGVEHLATGGLPPVPAEVVELSAPGAQPFLLVLGNDFMHKNRDFAIKVWQEVVTTTPVNLVLAGLHVAASSTGELEAQLLTGPQPDMGRVFRYEHVSSQAKTWLLANAAVVLYPTSAEGFGFVPHEAAVLGNPSVFTSFGPLAEFLPADAGCHGWQVTEYAQRARELLSDSSTRSEATAAIADAGSRLTWDAAADALMTAFRESLRQPPQPWGLWERTENPGVGGAWDEPVAPTEVNRALIAATYGNNWRLRTAARRARALAGRVKRTVLKKRRE